MLASNVASSALTSVTPLNCMLLTIIAIAKIVTCIFFAIFVKILYAIKTIIDDEHIFNMELQSMI